jgi:uncharacterized OB-fold protein
MKESAEAYLPRITEFSRPFWEGLKQGIFQTTRCLDCQTFSYPPHSLCPHCFSSRYEWARISGKATLYSFTKHEIVPRAYIKEAPYITAMVDLREGPRVLSRIKNGVYEDLNPGMPLKIGFGRLNEEIAIFYFEPEKK